MSDIPPQSLGGVARAKALSPERRSEIARMGALAKKGLYDPEVAAAEKRRRIALAKIDRKMNRLREALQELGEEAAGLPVPDLTAALDQVSALLRTAVPESPTEPGSAG